MKINWKKGKPDKSGNYLVVTDFGITTMSYSAKHKLWNAHDHFSYEESCEYSLTDAVIAWSDADIKELIKEVESNV